MRKALCKNTFCQKPKNGREQQHLQIFFFHFDFLDIVGRWAEILHSKSKSPMQQQYKKELLTDAHVFLRKQ